MDRQASKINIQKAQDTRRVIGVVKFIFKLQEYRKDETLWKRIQEEFDKYGFVIQVKK